MLYFSGMKLDELVEFRSSPEVKKKLMEYGTVKTFATGEVIQNENSYIRSIPIVQSGVIKVSRIEDDGREILLYYIQPGETCIMSFLGGIHQDTSKVKAIAEEPTEILLIPIEKVSSLIKEYPEWLDYIFRLYHKRFEELLEVVDAVGFKKMDDRLVQLLKSKAKLSNTQVIQITHEQLATELGTAREVVSRILKTLESEGVIQLGRNKITLM